ncbi:hypothetical protein EMIT0196MI5_250019 [Pseudomonas sp. IT-196MI5]
MNANARFTHMKDGSQEDWAIIFFHHLGMDRHLREQSQDHPQYQATVEFCARYDAAAFDPAYDTRPLSFFEPMMERLFAHPRNSIYKAAMQEHSPA